MLKNYLTVAFRSLMRNKVYSTLNVLGLGIGMACCVLIVLYVQNEFQYDRFHRNGDRIYKVVFETQNENGSRTIQWTTSGTLGPALKRDFPEVQETVRMWFQTVGLERQNRMLPARLSLVDKHVFDVFDLEFVTGDPQSAFENPSGMLITESTAKRLFGEEDPVGNTLTVDNKVFGGDYVVSGILKDYPIQSTIRFDLMITKVPRVREGRWIRWLPDWSWRSVHTFVLLSKGTDVSAVEQKLPDFMARYMGDEAQANNTYHLQPFHRIYLHSRADYGLGGFGDARQFT